MLNTFSDCVFCVCRRWKINQHIQQPRTKRWWWGCEELVGKILRQPFILITSMFTQSLHTEDLRMIKLKFSPYLPYIHSLLSWWHAHTDDDAHFSALQLLIEIVNTLSISRVDLSGKFNYFCPFPSYRLVKIFLWPQLQWKSSPKTKHGN